MPRSTEPSELTKATIWNFAQNKPSLVVADLSRYGVDPGVVYASLLRRGVFKWLAVRRDLIKLKNKWLGSLNQKDEEFKRSTGYHRAYLKGYRAAMRECRAEIRRLCHSERWRAPDFDKKAQNYLNSMEK